MRGLRGKKRYVIYNYLKENKFQVCLLQETFCTDDFVHKIRRGWQGDIIHSCSPSKHSRGVCILFSKDITYKLISTHKDNDGRILLVNVEINKVEYSMCNVYCPNEVSDRTTFLQYVKEFVKCHAISANNILIGGDFNCADSAIDKANGSLDKSSKQLFDLKVSLSLQDIWRYYNPERVEYSYIDPSRRGYNSRIDLWLGSKNIVSSSNHCVGYYHGPLHLITDRSF